MCEKFEKVPAKTDDDVGPNWTLCLYSVFSLTQKRCIVSLIAFAAWFSTLSSFIYFPAIPLLASDLRVSIEKIDLTVTSYLVISGLAPSIIGEYADHVGRRPVIMVVLLIYVVTNVGLALQTSFEALFVLRMLQSAGISGAFSIAYGVVADLASPAERGSFVGIASFGTNTAPSLGPLLGGLLAAHFGWRAIFWFLSIASAACLLAIIFALPETLRNIVGNGSLRATSVNRLPFPKMYALNDLERSSLSRNSRLQLPNPFTCIRVLLRRDTAIVVFTLGVLYTLYSCLQASLATLFIGLYDLTELQAGLIYLPFGLGCAMAAYFTGRLLDRDYRLTADVNGLPISRSGGDDLAKFPIEAARLRSLFYPLSIAIAAIAGYGWTVQAETHIAVPLVIQFISGSTLQCCFTILNTLLIDLNTRAPATAQAANNLVRCTLAAIALSMLQVMIDVLGVGWCFTTWALLGVLCIPLLLIERAYGMKWRKPRIEATNQEESAIQS